MKFSILYITLILFLIGCKKKEFPPDDVIKKDGPYIPTPLQLNLPPHFPQMVIPSNNPLTVEGVELGRYLFYEKKLSGDNTMSCGSCHSPSLAFADDNAFSIGIDGLQGTRNSMALINLGWANNYFWDGRSASLEAQAFLPVVDGIELHESWVNAIAELQADPIYPEMFKKAFGTYIIDSTLVVKAIAQFERTLISGNSKFDKVLKREAGFTPAEARGYDLFNSLSGADCFHCHGGVMTTDHSFQNNGLNAAHTDLGRAIVTGINTDEGKFKVPTLRNIALTAPYMHDGRFQTLEEVIDFYSTGLHQNSPNISPSMEFAEDGGVNLTPQEKVDLKAFLMSLTDTSFINNPKFQDPH